MVNAARLFALPGTGYQFGDYSRAIKAELMRLDELEETLSELTDECADVLELIPANVDATGTEWSL